MRKSSGGDYVSQSLSLEGFQAVCNVEDIEDDDMIEVKVEGIPLLIVRLNGHLYSTSAICTHEYARLSDGELEDDCITCPLHFARFNIRDGAAIDQPASRPLKVYEVRVHNKKIWINPTPKEDKNEPG